ncbi:hypothetical protein CYY_000818 [Polysphondylium violaceum]|uniref:Uncharacterized protein n=1 Tax=Polysphondylium violaceum TaxID=133409 RepID=A0A8J4Q134_9MYCE|nr:hypothetical protein CYY_000818 [Polysphondylium violaceum]
MNQLATVSQLLRAANAAAHSFPCSVPIGDILSKYQTLIRFSNMLASLATNLCQDAAKAINVVNENYVEKTQEERENKKKQTQEEELQASLLSDLKDLERQISQFKKQAQKYGRDAKSERERSFFLGAVSVVSNALASAYSPIMAVGNVLLSIMNSCDNSSESPISSNTESASDKVLEKKEYLNNSLQRLKQQLKEKKMEMGSLEAQNETPEIKEKIDRPSKRYQV